MKNNTEPEVKTIDQNDPSILKYRENFKAEFNAKFQEFSDSAALYLIFNDYDCVRAIIAANRDDFDPSLQEGGSFKPNELDESFIPDLLTALKNNPNGNYSGIGAAVTASLGKPLNNLLQGKVARGALYAASFKIKGANEVKNAQTLTTFLNTNDKAYGLISDILNRATGTILDTRLPEVVSTERNVHKNANKEKSADKKVEYAGAHRGTYERVLKSMLGIATIACKSQPTAETKNTHEISQLLATGNFPDEAVRARMLKTMEVVKARYLELNPGAQIQDTGALDNTSATTAEPSSLETEPTAERVQAAIPATDVSPEVMAEAKAATARPAILKTTKLADLEQQHADKEQEIADLMQQAPVAQQEVSQAELEVKKHQDKVKSWFSNTKIAKTNLSASQAKLETAKQKLSGIQDSVKIATKEQQDLRDNIEAQKMAEPKAATKIQKMVRERRERKKLASQAKNQGALSKLLGMLGFKDQGQNATASKQGMVAKFVAAVKSMLNLTKPEKPESMPAEIVTNTAKAEGSASLAREVSAAPQAIAQGPDSKPKQQIEKTNNNQDSPRGLSM